MSIRVLSPEDIRQIFTMEEAIDACSDALSIYSAGKSSIPLRGNIPVPESSGQCLYMYGYAAPANALGVKIVSVFPRNAESGLDSVPSTMVLVDNRTGYVSSIIEGTYLTRLRTGAVSGVATRLLSRKDSQIFSLIGSGGQAGLQLEAVLSVRDIKTVKVYSRNTEKLHNFVEKMKNKYAERFHVDILAASTADEAVDGADIITAVTTSQTPVFSGRQIKKNAHVNGVGSFTPDMAEIDSYTVTHAHKIYVDTLEGALKESGTLIQPVKQGIFHRDRITGELGQLILGEIPGRESDEEMTFFNTTGSAVMDLVTAQRIYMKALEKNVGRIIDL